MQLEPWIVTNVALVAVLIKSRCKVREINGRFCPEWPFSLGPIQGKMSFFGM